MPELIFIGGAPGVGKSTVARELLGRMEGSVWLDGDDLWRMHPFVVNEVTRGLVEKNIRHVLRSFLKTGFSYVFFTWVLHDKTIVDRLLNNLINEPFEFSMFILVCDEQTLLTRLSSDPERTTDTATALERLRQTQHLGAVKIDTTGKEPGAAAEEIMKKLKENYEIQ